MSRMLVSGATGFIGSNLIRSLLRDGHQVHTLQRPGRPSWRLAAISPFLCIHEAEIEDRAQVTRAVLEAKPDQVFHLAAYGGYASQTGFDRMLAVNLSGTAYLLDACVSAGVPVFVSAGSSSEYGHHRRAARETDLLQPNSHYAITKAAATHYCQFTARAAGIAAVTARLYSIYGPYEEPGRLVPTLLTRGLDSAFPPLVSPDVARDFVYVEDAVDALRLLANSAARLAPGAVYNICTGRQTTLREIVSHARALLSIAAEPEWSTMPDRAWDSNVWVGDPGAIARDLGWRTATDVPSGLRRTLDWLQSDERTLEFYRRSISRVPAAEPAR